jgi:uncharacterized protein
VTAARAATDATETETTRRCLASGAVRPKAELIRFVVGPDRQLVPDIAERLPGRGLWLTAQRDIVATAVAKRLFARAARGPVTVEDGLVDHIEALLARRAVEFLGLARRAGEAVAGFVKVQALLRAGKAAVLLAARDGAADGRRKLAALASGLPLVECLTGAELGAAWGRDDLVHAALARGRLVAPFLVTVGRLEGFRGQVSAGAAPRPHEGSGIVGK